MKDKIADAKIQLENFYSEKGEERCGFITEKGISEAKNIAAEPLEGFQIAGEEIIEYVENQSAWATWHTHPSVDCNLSGRDHAMFKMWSNLYHFVIGKDGIKCFKFDTTKKAVLEVTDAVA